MTFSGWRRTKGNGTKMRTKQNHSDVQKMYEEAGEEYEEAKEEYVNLLCELERIV